MKKWYLLPILKNKKGEIVYVHLFNLAIWVGLLILNGVVLPWLVLPAHFYFYIPAYIVTAGLLLHISTKLKYTKQITQIVV